MSSATTKKWTRKKEVWALVRVLEEPSSSHSVALCCLRKVLWPSEALLLHMKVVWNRGRKVGLISELLFFFVVVVVKVMRVQRKIKTDGLLGPDSI